MFLNDREKPLAKLWIGRVGLLAKGWQSKADSQRDEGHYCADFHCFVPVF